MSCQQVVKQFEDLRQTIDFLQFEKDFADSLVSSIQKWSTAGEVPTVKALDGMINNPKLKRNGFSPAGIRYDLNTNSVFIHGKKSLVQFKYPGGINAPVELGDLLMICTLVYGGKRYFERLTIVQFKMENHRKNCYSWTIDNDKQLYLLSRFPTFTGVAGILARGTNYSLRNKSGCLGSYGLLQMNGDLVFVSGTELDINLGKSRTIRKNQMRNYSSSIFFNGLFLDNCQVCLDAHNFAGNYLGLNIGEFTVSCGLSSNIQVRNLLSFVISLMHRLKKQGQATKEILNFLNSFSHFPYSDGFGQEYIPTDQNFPNDNGIGIIHTIINIGEGNDTPLKNL